MPAIQALTAPSPFALPAVPERPNVGVAFLAAFFAAGFAVLLGAGAFLLPFFAAAFGFLAGAAWRLAPSPTDDPTFNTTAPAAALNLVALTRCA